MSSGTILLVDDDLPVLKALRVAVEHHGHRALFTTRPEEALDLLTREPIDVLISDIEMPDMNGLELVTRVRKAHPAVVRILLTARSSIDLALRAINSAEVFRFVMKPWDLADLRSVLAEAVDRAHHLRARNVEERVATRRRNRVVTIERQFPELSDVHRQDGAYVITQLAALDAYPPDEPRTALDSLVRRLGDLLGAARPDSRRPAAR